MIIAFGVELSLRNGYDGTVHFKAKTTELFLHYQKTYHAFPIPAEHYALILFGDEGIPLLNDYKEVAP